MLDTRHVQLRAKEEYRRRNRYRWEKTVAFWCGIGLFTIVGILMALARKKAGQ